jgi:hypothetical protein
MYIKYILHDSKVKKKKEEVIFLAIGGLPHYHHLGIAFMGSVQFVISFSVDQDAVITLRDKRIHHHSDHSCVTGRTCEQYAAVAGNKTWVNHIQGLQGRL